MAYPYPPLVQQPTVGMGDMMQFQQNQQRLGLAQQGLDLDRQNMQLRRSALDLNRFKALTAEQRERAKERTRFLGTAALAIRQVPPMQRAGIIEQWRGMAQQQGIDVSGVTDQQLLDDNYLNLALSQLRDVDKALKETEPPEGMQFGEGGSLEMIPGYVEGQGRLAAANRPPEKPNYARYKEVAGGIYDLKSKTWLEQPKDRAAGTEFERLIATLPENEQGPARRARIDKLTELSGMSIGVGTGPWIGVQKGPLFGGAWAGCPGSA